MLRSRPSNAGFRLVAPVGTEKHKIRYEYQIRKASTTQGKHMFEGK